MYLQILTNWGGVNLHPFVDSQGYTHTVTVSLTSYGDRVYSVCYVIYSILMQSVQPNRIILWLSEQEYNDENLPQSLKDLRSRGGGNSLLSGLPFV